MNYFHGKVNQFNHVTHITCVTYEPTRNSIVHEVNKVNQILHYQYQPHIYAHIDKYISLITLTLEKYHRLMLSTKSTISTNIYIYVLINFFQEMHHRRMLLTKSTMSPINHVTMSAILQWKSCVAHEVIKVNYVVHGTSAIIICSQPNFTNF